MKYLKKEFIAAGGSAVIHRQSGRELVVLLGSCVGVALIDQQAGVGGLIHLLLPEPPECRPGIEEGLYARTGLPLFIDMLAEQGAERSRLKATVAGGALTMPISLVDLRLDIGGRLTEVVLEILLEAGISIDRTETGGVQGTCLRLDSDRLQAVIEPVVPRTIVPAAETRPLSQEEIHHAVAGVKPVPQIVLRLLRVIEREEHSLSEITEELEHDQVLGAKLLKLCNSPFYGPARKIDSLDRAVLLLGEHLLREMVLTVAMRDMLDQQAGGYALMRGGLFHHSCAVASAARIIASLGTVVDPAIAFTAGLLHDIGKVVLDTHLAQVRPFFYRQQEVGKSLNELERQFLGIDHGEAGRLLAESWGLPDNLVAVIGHHHGLAAEGGFRELIATVQLANCIVSSVLATPDRLEIEPGAVKEILDVLKVSPDILARVVAEVPWRAINSL